MNQFQKSQAEKILASYVSQENDLEKGGKRAFIGEVRNYSGQDWVKHHDGWVLVHASGNHILERPGGKREPASKEHVDHANKHMDKQAGDELQRHLDYKKKLSEEGSVKEEIEKTNISSTTETKTISDSLKKVLSEMSDNIVLDTSKISIEDKDGLDFVKLKGQDPYSWVSIRAHNDQHWNRTHFATIQVLEQHPHKASQFSSKENAKELIAGYKELIIENNESIKKKDGAIEDLNNETMSILDSIDLSKLKGIFMGCIRSHPTYAPHFFIGKDKESIERKTKTQAGTKKVIDMSKKSHIMSTSYPFITTLVISKYLESIS